MSYYKNFLHLLVLVCEYLKSTHGFVPGYSRGQTMKRSIRITDLRRLRQLGSSPIISIACDPKDGASEPLYLLVIVCEYLKSTHGFVPGYSRGQTMKRSTRMKDPNKVTTTRIISHHQHCLWPRRWSFAYATFIITYFRCLSCIKNWIMRSLFV